MERKNRLFDTCGASLIAAVFLILVLSFLGWVMLSMSNLASRESVNELYSARAYYDACSAAEATIVLLDQPELYDPDNPDKISDGDIISFSYQFEQGQADVKAEVTEVVPPHPEKHYWYWQLTTTGIIGKAGPSGKISSEHAKRRLIVKFLK